MDYVKGFMEDLKSSESVSTVDRIGEDTLYVTRRDGRPDRIYSVNPKTGDRSFRDVEEETTEMKKYEIVDLDKCFMREVG